MNFAQKIWLLPDFEPVIVRELDQNPILVAVVDDVQISRLIIELEIVDTQLFGMLNINGGLHLSAIAQSRPMTGAERSLFIREFRVVLCPAHRPYSPGRLFGFGFTWTIAIMPRSS